jgi:PAS domain S-box-containing protein
MTASTRPVPDGVRSRSLWRATGLAPLVAAGIVLLVAVAVTHVLGTRIATRLNPQLHTLEQAYADATSAHLEWLEAWQAGQAEPLSGVSSQFASAGADLRLLLDGGASPVGRVRPMTRAAQRAEVETMLGEIARVVATVRTPPARPLAGDPDLPGGEHDSVCRNLLARMRTIEDQLRTELGANQAEYRIAQAALAVISILFVLAATLFLAVNIRQLREIRHRLQQSEQHFAQVVQQMPVMVVAEDDRKRVSIWNRECERVTGYSAAEITDRPGAFELLYPDALARARITQEWKQVRGGFRDSEWELTCKDGTRRIVAWSDVSAQVPVRGWRNWAVGVDVTQQRKAVTALRDSRTRYAELVRNMTSAVAVYEAVDGGEDFIFREFNPAAEKMEGVARAKLIDRSVREVFPGVEDFGIFAVFQRVYRTGKPERYSTALYKDESHQGWRDNYVYKLPNGEVVAIYTDETERMNALRALQESESRFRTMFETAQDCIFIKDRELRYTQVNPAMERLFGRTASELLGRTDAELFGGTAGAHIAEVDRRVIAGKVVEEEHTKPVNGTDYLFHVVKTPLRNDAGEVIGLFGISRDVTERRRADDQLRYHASLLESIPDAVVSVDPDFRILSWNRGAEAMYGWREEEVTGQSVQATLAPEYFSTGGRDVVLSDFARTGSWSGEVRHRRRDGSRIDVRLSAAALRDAAGRPCGAVTVSRDITEHKRDIEARFESEARFRAITENSLDITTIFDREGAFSYVSPSVQRIMGFEPDELLGRSAFAEVFPGDAERMGAVFAKALEHPGDTIEVPEYRVRRKDGEWVYLEGTLTSMVGIPGVGGLVANMRDVTDRRRVEGDMRRAQKMEAVGTLASGIAHDFNNILYAVLGYAELVRDDLPRDGQLRDNIEQVILAGQRATEIVRRLLTFTRQSEQTRRPTALAPIIDETLKLLRGTLPSTIRIETRIGPCGDVVGDSTQIQQVLMNLCTNAYQSMRELGGRLEVGLDETELAVGDPRLGEGLPPGRYARIEVRDTGCGMDRVTLERIFEPYFSTKAIGEGTGLGLAVVHGILRRHRGAVQVESEVGRGSTFAVYLPMIVLTDETDPIQDTTVEGMQWRAS